MSRIDNYFDLNVDENKDTITDALGLDEIDIRNEVRDILKNGSRANSSKTMLIKQIWDNDKWSISKKLAILWHVSSMITRMEIKK